MLDHLWRDSSSRGRSAFRERTCPLTPVALRLELLYALRLRERRRVLGIAAGDDELAGEAASLPSGMPGCGASLRSLHASLGPASLLAPAPALQLAAAPRVPTPALPWPLPLP